MNAVVHVLINSKSSDDPEQKYHSRRHPKNRQQGSQHDGSGNVSTHREHRAWIDVMLVMERRHERAMRMSEHAVDDVFEEGPGEESGNEN